MPNNLYVGWLLLKVFWYSWKMFRYFISKFSISKRNSNFHNKILSIEETLYYVIIIYSWRVGIYNMRLPYLLLWRHADIFFFIWLLLVFLGIFHTITVLFIYVLYVYHQFWIYSTHFLNLTNVYMQHISHLFTYTSQMLPLNYIYIHTPRYTTHPPRKTNFSLW